MIQSYRGLIVVVLSVLLIITACQEVAPELEISSPAPTIEGKPLQPISISPVTLVRNPAALENQFLELSGNYKQVPVQVCADESHLSPISWQLVVEGVEVPASGFDRELRELGNDGMPMVVGGRWKQWEGPVGCGRRAPEQQIWYLAVADIISPNPLAAGSDGSINIAEGPGSSPGMTAAPPEVTVISLGTATTSAGTGSEEGQPSLTAAATTTSNSVEAATVSPGDRPDINATATDIAAGAPTGGTRTEEGTPTATHTPAPELTHTPATTPTTTADLSATPTPVGSPSPGASTTPIGSGTPVPTNTPGATESSEELLIYEDLFTDMVLMGSAKQYEFEGEIGDEVTISAAPDVGLDIALELTLPGGIVLANRNESGVGEPETINQILLSESGRYGIRVISMNDNAGDFGLALSDAESEAFLIFTAVIDFGASGTEDLPAGTDHLLTYVGLPGETINFEVESLNPSNMVLYIYDPTGLEMEFVDDDETSSAGSLETVTDFNLPIAGLYIFRIGEWDFNAASYQYSFEEG